MIKALKGLSPSTKAAIGLTGTGAATLATAGIAGGKKMHDLHKELDDIAKENSKYEVSDDLYNDLRSQLDLKTPVRKLTQDEAREWGMENNAFYLDKATIKDLINAGYDDLFDGVKLKDIQDTGIVATSPGMHNPDVVSHELGHGRDDAEGGLYNRGTMPVASKIGTIARLAAPFMAAGLHSLGLKSLPSAAIALGPAAVPSIVGNYTHWKNIVTDEEDANRNGDRALRAVYEKYKDQLPPDLLTGGYERAREAALDTYKTGRNTALASQLGWTLTGIGLTTLGLKARHLADV